jgi:hypothetical protein
MPGFDEVAVWFAQLRESAFVHPAPRRRIHGHPQDPHLHLAQTRRPKLDPISRDRKRTSRDTDTVITFVDLGENPSRFLPFGKPFDEASFFGRTSTSRCQRPRDTYHTCNRHAPKTPNPLVNKPITAFTYF